jgi:hypothetical protein
MLAAKLRDATKRVKELENRSNAYRSQLEWNLSRLAIGSGFQGKENLHARVRALGEMNYNWHDKFERMVDRLKVRRPRILDFVRPMLSMLRRSYPSWY